MTFKFTYNVAIVNITAKIILSNKVDLANCFFNVLFKGDVYVCNCVLTNILCMIAEMLKNITDNGSVERS